MTQHQLSLIKTGESTKYMLENGLLLGITLHIRIYFERCEEHWD
jgi:hypothetical protein